MSEIHDYNRSFDAGVYDEAYFEGDGHKSGYTSYSDAEGIVSDQFAIIDKVMSDRVDPNGTHLDVGCAYGFGCEEMYSRGWQTSGVDVSEYAISEAKRRHSHINFRVLDIRDAHRAKLRGRYGLVTAVELFEHIETTAVPYALLGMSMIADWGLFVINGRTNPDQALDSTHGDHGHLNNHSMSWWITEIAKHGDIDFDAMFEFSKLAEAEHPEVHWHNRCVVVKFNHN